MIDEIPNSRFKVSISNLKPETWNLEFF